VPYKCLGTGPDANKHEVACGSNDTLESDKDWVFNKDCNSAANTCEFKCEDGYFQSGSTCIRICGDKAKVYPFNATGYGSGDFCNQGSPSPANPDFPNPGETEGWDCGVENCEASRQRDLNWREVAPN